VDAFEPAQNFITHGIFAIQSSKI